LILPTLKIQKIQVNYFLLSLKYVLCVKVYCWN